MRTAKRAKPHKRKGRDGRRLRRIRALDRVEEQLQILRKRQPAPPQHNSSPDAVLKYIQITADIEKLVRLCDVLRSRI